MRLAEFLFLFIKFSYVKIGENKFLFDVSRSTESSRLKKLLWRNYVRYVFVFNSFSLRLSIRLLISLNVITNLCNS